MIRIPLLVIPTLFTILLRSRYRTPLILPYIFGTLAAWGGLVLSWHHRELVVGFLPTLSLTWVPNFMVGTVRWIIEFWGGIVGAITAIAVSAAASLLAFSGLGAFFVEIFLERALKDHNLIAPEHPNTLKYLVITSIRALLDDIKKILIFGVIGILLFLTGFFPPLTLIVFLLGTLILGMQIADEPLKLMKIPFKRRWEILKSNKLDLLSLGMTSTVLFLIPFGAIVFMPVAQLLSVKQMAGWPAVQQPNG